jgi:hypothetical protein
MASMPRVLAPIGGRSWRCGDFPRVAKAFAVEGIHRKIAGGE